jgi:hypothetical protein
MTFWKQRDEFRNIPKSETNNLQSGLDRRKSFKRQKGQKPEREAGSRQAWRLSNIEKEQKLSKSGYENH